MFNSCEMYICSIFAIGLFSSMLYMLLNLYFHAPVIQFINTLDSQQQQIFLQIHDERIKIFVLSVIIGLICGTILLLILEHGAFRSCGFLFITLSVTYLVYMLHPKTKYMINYLVRPNQKRAWIHVYKSVRYNLLMSALLGIGAYILVSLL